ncbi:Phage recombinase domain protein (plasmid) [Candidatus Trichorickettsia mobilis]|uniref:tyrosine-type recombinase/integrase n=1 Tax=Candidatus Trichorickettsia mobilis TaxID=1346319 RepID=UPI002B25F860|nr:tyrosine-type recombinase/integrase [Candidatus Trichorickettsia mobilis]WPY01750.1 Phage recombinase domain protein [Candidatus Trichorickettsia mobilis]
MNSFEITELIEHKNAAPSNNQTAVTITNDLSKYLQDFLSEQDIKENSKGTYKRALTQFFSFMPNSFEQLTSNDILTYKRHLESLELAAYTITAYLVVVRRFFAWTEAKKIYPNIAKTIKGMRRPKEFRKDPLTMEQTREVISGIDLNTLQGKRDFAIINLLVRTGLRTIEIQRANIEDINQTGGVAKLHIQGKGRDTKDDYVILTHASLKPILSYLKCRGETKDTDPLFTSLSDRNNGGRMTTRSLSRIAKGVMIEAGIDSKRLTAHSLRHTAITTALRAGASLQEVKAMARHADMNTTLIYSHNIDRETNAPEHKIDAYMEKYAI